MVGIIAVAVVGIAVATIVSILVAVIIVVTIWRKFNWTGSFPLEFDFFVTSYLESIVKPIDGVVEG